MDAVKEAEAILLKKQKEEKSKGISELSITGFQSPVSLKPLTGEVAPLLPLIKMVIEILIMRTKRFFRRRGIWFKRMRPKR